MLSITRTALITLLCSSIAVPTPVIAAPTPGTSASYFFGLWHCKGVIPATKTEAASTYSTPNDFEPAPGKRWMTNRWGSQDLNGGIALIGYVAALKQWVYDDYHYDGGFARVTSPGLVGGRWVWSGPYYTPGGQTLHGRIIYSVRGADRFDRSFETPSPSGFKALGGDTCSK